MQKGGDRRVRSVVAWITLPLCGFLSGMTLPGEQAAEATGAETQHVHGIVVNSVTNAPVPRALVTSADGRMALLANSEGKFEFEVRLPGGSSRSGGLVSAQSGGFAVDGSNSVFIMALKPGYRRMERFTPLPLEAEALKAEVQVRLIPEAIIAGRVVAPGTSVPTGVQVQLMQKQVEEGRGMWRPAQVAQSDLHGEYRFADLPAGEYKIRTNEWMEPGGLAPVPGKQMVGYPPMFYPHGTSLASAALLHLATGQTLQADLDLRPKSYFPVEIPVANFLPGTGLGVTVEGQEAGAAFALGFNQRTQRVEGALPSGLYHVTVSSYGAEQGTATIELAVAGKAIRTAPVSLLPGASIRVIVREEYTAAADALPGDGAPITRMGGGFLRDQSRSLEVYLQPERPDRPGAGLSNNPGKSASNDGLQIENVNPGSYHVMVMPHRGYAAAVTTNGLDLLHRPLVVDAGASIPAIEITLRDDTGTISGTVSPALKREDTARLGGMTSVWCFPAGEQGAGRPVQGFVDPESKFTIPNVAPGRYVVFASSSPNQNNIEYRNEATMRRLESQGTMVTLAPGEKATISAPMLAAEVN